MKRSLVILCIATAALCGCGDKVEQDVAADAPTTRIVRGDLTEDECLTICRDASSKLGAALKEALQSAMAAGGPTEALSVCNVEAVPIARTISVQEGLMISRTSARFRNPANAPDDWESPRLAELADRLAAGEDPAGAESWQVVAYPEGHHTFRYLKAIPTAEMCLVCHGTALASPVAERIAALYPDDLAKGFAPGELRGAFTLSLPLD